MDRVEIDEIVRFCPVLGSLLDLVGAEMDAEDDEADMARGGEVMLNEG